MFAAFGYFFPIFGAGNTVYAFIGESILLWAFHFLILRGVRQAAILNVVVTIMKLVPILLFLVLVSLLFKLHTFTFHFWGAGHLGSIFAQVKSTMLVTLWVFIGIEGASVESSRARSPRDVGRATVLGLGVILILYVLISLLSFGIVSQSVLAKAPNPSMAFVLAQAVGPWGAVVVNLGVILSLFGAWLDWTLLCVQLPLDCARDESMPRFLGKNNKNDAPVNALWLSNGLIQVVLLSSLFFHQGYLTLAKLATSCILVPYLLCALYALKSRHKGKIFALIASIYAVWLVYAAGLYYLLLSTVLYALGIIFYVWARKQHRQVIFTGKEYWLAGAVIILAISALVYFI